MYVYNSLGLNAYHSGANFYSSTSLTYLYNHSHNIYLFHFFLSSPRRLRIPIPFIIFIFVAYTSFIFFTYILAEARQSVRNAILYIYQFYHTQLWIWIFFAINYYLLLFFFFLLLSSSFRVFVFTIKRSVLNFCSLLSRFHSFFFFLCYYYW